jgi:protein-disulfide isomerase
MSMRIGRSVPWVAVVLLAVCGCAASAGDSAKKQGKTPPGAAAGGLQPASPAAVVGDVSITLAEIDAEAAPSLRQVRQQEFDIRKATAESMLNKRVVDKEAAARGISADELLKKEVTDKVADATPAEIDSWYEQNKARVGNQTKEQLAPQIAQMLRGQKTTDLQRNFYKELRRKHGARVLLEPSRMEVAVDDDPARGPAKAPVTIVEFSDFQCPYCSRAETVVDEVFKKYPDQVRLVFRDYPLSFHANASTAAQGGECAEEQGKFWEMHRAMFANQQKLAAADLVETAGTIGLNKDKFKQCLDSEKYKAEVEKDFEDGQKYGVSGTPTFFINGIPMVGAKGVDAFAEIIDSELERKR